MQTFFAQYPNLSNILEVGIAAGDSLRWARNYFAKSAIFGIDINLPEPRRHHHGED